MQRWSWACLALLVCWPSEAALAQSRARLGEALLVEPDKNGCITHAAVLARVLHWLKPSVEIGDVQVLVRGSARPPSFVVRRGTGSPAERSFDLLPARCRDRVDALALAIAIALEEIETQVGSQASKPPAVPAAQGSPAQAAASDSAPNRVPSGGLELQPGWEVAASAPPPRVLPGPAAGAGVVASASRPRQAAPDPSREADADTSMPAPAPSPSSSDAGRPAAADAAQERTLLVRLRAGVDGMIEVLPEPVLGVHAGGELVFDPERRWSVGLDALISSESETHYAGGRVFAQLYAGRAVACFDWPLEDGALSACAGTGMGVAVARGKDFAPPENTALFWASALLRAALRYPRGGVVAGRLAIDGFANLATPEYHVKETETPPLAAGRLGAAASLELIVALE
jgi:hypothetical protein